ncbi:MAG: glycyl-tRNA synthetase [Microgenomates group bacterium LiPW_16]|nr:MAG: glycyl-tRNA synthetase [Microgenomates group bacterium LiPW_16]
MPDLMEKIVALGKRRGFIFPSSEIYGGLAGFWDAGPLGTELKNNIKNLWWKTMVYDRENIIGLDSTIIHNPKVWQASGHAVSFTDPLRECKSCHQRFRADKLKSQKCPECGGELTETKQFNLMFKTYVGPAEETASLAFLRPETCQGIFINFGNVIDVSHPKLPFGIAQIGKGFRNEITTGDFIFRDREFEMMELEYFVKPGEDEKWFEYWKEERMKWHLSLGIKKENLRFFEHPKKSLAHYSKRTVDIEYNFPFGWSELEGIANRTDFDLKNHSKFSGRDLSYQDEETDEKFYPYVVEPSLGVERMMLVLLVDGYWEDGERLVLKLDPKLAPIKIAVFPLLANKPELVKLARKIYEDLKPYFVCAWDDRGNIGKRYYAQDEIGTPCCITVDFDTLEDETVTIRDRDTTYQERIKIEKLKEYFEKKLEE